MDIVYLDSVYGSVRPVYDTQISARDPASSTNNQNKSPHGPHMHVRQRPWHDRQDQDICELKHYYVSYVAACQVSADPRGTTSMGTPRRNCVLGKSYIRHSTDYKHGDTTLQDRELARFEYI